MIQWTENQEYLTLKIRADRLEASNISTFKNELNAMPPLGLRELRIDMEQVAFIDSSGIGTLLGLMSHALSEPKHLTLLHTQAQINNVIQMLRLNKVLIIE